jgi:hypothetical protein
MLRRLSQANGRDRLCGNRWALVAVVTARGVCSEKVANTLVKGPAMIIGWGSWSFFFFCLFLTIEYQMAKHRQGPAATCFAFSVIFYFLALYSEVKPWIRIGVAVIPIIFGVGASYMSRPIEKTIASRPFDPNCFDIQKASKCRQF